METVEVVIRLPRNLYLDVKNGHASNIQRERVIEQVKNGTVLPKGHSRLIDASQLFTVTECREDGTEHCYVPYAFIEDAPTIIKADREVEDESQDKPK